MKFVASVTMKMQMPFPWHWAISIFYEDLMWWFKPYSMSHNMSAFSVIKHALYNLACMHCSLRASKLHTNQRKMWRKVNGEAFGTQTVYKTFSFRHLFSWNVEGLLFSVYLQHQCLMRTCHHSIWKQTPVWAFLHAIITYCVSKHHSFISEIWHNAQ